MRNFHLVPKAATEKLSKKLAPLEVGQGLVGGSHYFFRHLCSKDARIFFLEFSFLRRLCNFVFALVISVPARMIFFKRVLRQFKAFQGIHYCDSKKKLKMWVIFWLWTISKVKEKVDLLPRPFIEKKVWSGGRTPTHTNERNRWAP